MMAWNRCMKNIEDGANMSEYRKLVDEFKIKVKILQETCPHIILSKPIPVKWAIGHLTGQYVRCCESCNKKFACTEAEAEQAKEEDELYNEFYD